MKIKKVRIWPIILDVVLKLKIKLTPAEIMNTGQNLSISIQILQGTTPEVFSNKTNPTTIKDNADVIRSNCLSGSILFCMEIF